jgi:hypothetical protein
MDPALIKLLRLRFRGALRRTFRGVKTVRGMVFFLLGLGMLLMWLWPQIMLLFMGRGGNNPQTLRDVLPVALLGLSLMAIIGGARQEGISFTPAEIDFLFSGPFTRRQLLVYKLASGMMASLIVALFFSIWMLRYASLWLAAYLGTVLALIFVHLLSTMLVLIGQTMAHQLYTRVRKAFSLLIIALLIVLAARWLPAVLDQGFQKTAHNLRISTVGFWLFMPLEPFVRTIAAENIMPELIGWAAAAMVVDLALLALVLQIDVNYLESSIVVSRKRYALLQQRRSTGRLIVKPQVAWRVPRLPWLGGAGPIAWRQLTTAMRGMYGFLPFFLIFSGLAAAPLLLHNQKSSEGWGVLIGQLCFLTIIMIRYVAFDFRGDLDYMDWAKSLPIRPFAITLGQLATPVLMMTFIHLSFLAIIAFFAPGAHWMLVAAAIFSLPFNFLLFGIDNLFFLLFPIRMVATSPGDFQYIGRTMVELFVKIFVLAFGCGISALVGMAGYWLSGGSWAATLALAWLGLLLCGCLLVPCVAWAYNRFDVSTDMPA